MAQSGTLFGEGEPANNRVGSGRTGDPVATDAVTVPAGINKWLVLAVVAVGGFMASLNSASLIIILPTLQRDLHTALINIFWVLLAYVLASAILLLTVGRGADLWGNKRIYLWGYAIFGVGSVLSAVAPEVNTLIAARFIQGIGGAMLTANASAIITHTFPRRELGRALGVTSMVYAVGTTLGPIVGGLLTDAINWRWAFWVNVPIAVVGFVLAYYFLYNEVGTRASARREGFDLPGAGLLAVSFATLLYFVSFGPMYGWGSRGMLLALAVCVVATALFFWRQLSVSQPLLDLRLFGNRLFAMANFSAAFATMGMIAVLFLLPFYLEDVLHYSLFMSAVLLTPFPLTMLIVSPVSGYLSDRFGSRLLGTLGMVIAAISLASLSTLTLHESYGPIAFRLVILGIGMGLFQSPNNSAVMGSVPGARRGVASAVLGTMRNLGQMLGIGIIGAVFVSFMPFNAFLQLALTGATTATGAAEVVAAFRICYLVATGFALVGAVTSLVRGRHAAHGQVAAPDPAAALPDGARPVASAH
ncbi:MAG TPA: MFS transporter [Ktedonobacterales bacterium]